MIIISTGKNYDVYRNLHLIKCKLLFFSNDIPRLSSNKKNLDIISDPLN